MFDCLKYYSWPLYTFDWSHLGVAHAFFFLPPLNHIHVIKYINSNTRLYLYAAYRLFPTRFTPTSSELIIPVASGDYPHVIPSKLPHTTGVAPVLMFGSVFRDINNVYPNMVAMPMPPQQHLGCFVEWVKSGRVCKYLLPSSDNSVIIIDADDDDGGDEEEKDSSSSTSDGTLVFGEDYGLEWNDLMVSI